MLGCFPAVHNKKSGNSHQLFMQSMKADKPSEQHWGLAEQPEEESQRRLTGLRRSGSVQPQWRKSSTSSHRTWQNQGEYKTIHLVFSLGHSSRGECRRACSSPQKHLRQRDISKTRQIKGRMGKTKELAKNCPSTYYMGRGPTSHVSLWLPDLQNSVSFISFSKG